MFIATSIVRRRAMLTFARLAATAGSERSWRLRRIIDWKIEAVLTREGGAHNPRTRRQRGGLPRRSPRRPAHSVDLSYHPCRGKACCCMRLIASAFRSPYPEPSQVRPSCLKYCIPAFPVMLLPRNEVAAGSSFSPRHSLTSTSRSCPAPWHRLRWVRGDLRVLDATFAPRVTRALPCTCRRTPCRTEIHFFRAIFLYCSTMYDTMSSDTFR